MNLLTSKILKALIFYFGYTAFKKTVRKVTKSRKIFILYYHRINIEAKPYFGSPVNPNIFEKQIRYLKRNFEIIDFEQLHEMSDANGLKKDYVLITFDDGYRDNYLYAYPVLKKYRVKATIFLTTDYISNNNLMWPDRLAWILYNAVTNGSQVELGNKIIGNNLKNRVNEFFIATESRVHSLRRVAALMKDYEEERREEILQTIQKRFYARERSLKDNRCMLSWDEVKEMAQNGVSFGSHTKSHPVLSRISREKSEEEIVESKEVIEKKLDKKILTFAYPYGKKNDYSADIMAILRNSGYRFACSTVKGTEAIPLRRPFELKRKPMSIIPYVFL